MPPDSTIPASRRRQRLACIVTLAAAAAASVPGAAGAASLNAEYRITLSGLTVGTADFALAVAGDRYDAKVTAKLTGLAGALSGGGDGGGAASGTLAGNRPVPAGFSATGRSGGFSRTVRMGVAGGNVAAIDIEPPFEERPDRVPVTEANKRGIIDPLSGLLAVAANPAKPIDPANCNRTLPVFDGSQRFNIVLSYADTRLLARPYFTGNVLVCHIRYVPIAGHRPLRPSVKFMEENRDMSVWLAPLAGTRVLVPIRIQVATMIGTSILEAERWKVD